MPWDACSTLKLSTEAGIVFWGQHGEIPWQGEIANLAQPDPLASDMLEMG